MKPGHRDRFFRTGTPFRDFLSTPPFLNEKGVSQYIRLSSVGNEMRFFYWPKKFSHERLFLSIIFFEIGIMEEKEFWFMILSEH